jgi:hypothetical protein
MDHKGSDAAKSERLNPNSLAKRIQALCLPQHWGTVLRWHEECQSLCSDFHEATIDPRFKPPFCAKWFNTERPFACWPYSENDWSNDLKLPDRPIVLDFQNAVANFRNRSLYDVIVSANCDIKDFPNALWGWFSIVQWFRNSGPIEKEATELFHILMRCGCSYQQFLNCDNQQNRRLLGFCSQFPWVLRLLFGANVEPFVKARWNYVSGHLVCHCDVCPLLSYRPVAKALIQECDIACLSMLQRISHSERITLVEMHGILSYTVFSGKELCFELLWRDLMMFIRKAVGFSSHVQAMEVFREVLAKGAVTNVNDKTHSSSLLAMIASSENELPWRLFTHVNPLTDILLAAENADGKQDRSHISPISAALNAGYDQRAAWLVSRLRMEHLNRYDAKGLPPIILAAHKNCKLTLRALLSRGVEVDLTACELVQSADSIRKSIDVQSKSSNVLLLPKSDLANTWLAATIFNNKPDLDLQLSDDLRALTDFQMSVMPVLNGEVVMRILLVSPCNVPADVLRICFAYMSIPIPKIWWSQSASIAVHQSASIAVHQSASIAVHQSAQSASIAVYNTASIATSKTFHPPSNNRNSNGSMEATKPNKSTMKASLGRTYAEIVKAAHIGQSQS